MGRLRSLVASLAAAALLGLGTGCAGGGFWKSKPADYPSDTTGQRTGLTAQEQGGVIPAGGTMPISTMPSALSWLSSKGDKAVKSGPTVTLVSAWQNHIDHLPDPARNGQMGPGLAGQIFVFGSNDFPTTLEGSLTVDLFDETPRAPGQPALKPERWKFNKDVLKALRSVDERFGPNYVIFLPWPAYRPDVTRVRIAVRFDPDNGSFPVYAPESRLTLDPGALDIEAERMRTLRTLSSVKSTTVPAAQTSAPQSSGTMSPNTGAIAAGSTPASTSPGPGLGIVRMTGPARQHEPAGEASQR
jgi:hypothetical protein